MFNSDVMRIEILTLQYQSSYSRGWSQYTPNITWQPTLYRWPCTLDPRRGRRARSGRSSRGSTSVLD